MLEQRENPAQLAAIGEALTVKYMREMAPAIDPPAVELRVEGEVGGVSVLGWIDILDSDGQVVDTKPPARD